jgi:hypothetical protein
LSLQLVQQFAQPLPPRLREDIIGYARSVQIALPDIFRDANLAQDERLGDQLVFLAGVKKLYAICSGTFWILDNSLESLQNINTHQVKIGSLRISRGSRDWQRLRDLLTELEGILAFQGLQEIVETPTYPEILRRLRDEH